MLYIHFVFLSNSPVFLKLFVFHAILFLYTNSLSSSLFLL